MSFPYGCVAWRSGSRRGEARSTAGRQDSRGYQEVGVEETRRLRGNIARVIRTMRCRSVRCEPPRWRSADPALTDAAMIDS